MRNKYIVHKDCVEVLCTQKGETVSTYVDLEDLARIPDITLSVLQSKGDHTKYIVFRLMGKKVLLHRYLMNAPHGKVIDHIDRDGLNNRKSNLRITTTSGNAQNKNRQLKGASTSGHTGISWNKGKSKWHARIYNKGQQIFLGYFDNIDDAVKARRDAEEKYWGFRTE